MHFRKDLNSHGNMYQTLQNGREASLEIIRHVFQIGEV